MDANNTRNELGVVDSIVIVPGVSDLSEVSREKEEDNLTNIYHM